MTLLTAGNVSGTENINDVAEGLTMEFVRIPAGSFQIGSPASEKDRDENEGPAHEVKIDKPFYMGKYEVTQAQWETVMGTTIVQQRKKSSLPWLSNREGPKCPMYYVSWEEAVEFCKRLGDGFRLPTEAEWEYACRAGSQTRFYYGDDPNYSQLGEYAWYYGNSDNRTHPVGQKKPNAWSLYDMYGNVSEWCSGKYAIKGGYEIKSDEQTDSDSRYLSYVIRGGSWLDKSNTCRSAIRRPGVSSDTLGFRVVFTGDGNKENLEIELPKTNEPFVNSPQKTSKHFVGRFTISGIVLDDSGEPVDDVDIQPPLRSDVLVRKYNKGRFEAHKQLRKSDPEEYHLVARHIERNLAAVADFGKDANMLEVRLEPGVILTGKVVDSNNNAIEGARVGTLLKGSDWQAAITPIGMKTDKEGKFSFKALPLGQDYRISVTFLNYRRAKIEFNSSDARDSRIDLKPIVLLKGQYSISGIVVDANDKPVANVELYCTGKDQPFVGAKTDANGKFKADGIFEGEVDISAGVRDAKYGRWILWGSTKANAGATDVKIVLNNKGYAPPKGRACFPGDTDVWVNGSVVSISRIACERSFCLADCSSLVCPSGQIEKIQEHRGMFECRDILLENGNSISVVDSHCFMLDTGRWIAAQDLKKGLRLKTKNGSVGIKSVTIRKTPFVGKVYNLKIKDSDRYMVGKDGVIVRDY